ncbi:MAG TPA: hypothetical protein VK815_13325 [Candidatus Acidoferrales bacterium]|nr:hypothetical protein [Candidatus Acidoferrales bacterium]
MGHQVVAVDELFPLLLKKDTGPVQIFGSAAAFLRLFEKLEKERDKQWLLDARIHSAFCFVENGGGNPAGILAKLSVGTKAKLVAAKESSEPWKVSETAKDFTGLLTGLTVAPVAAASGLGPAGLVRGLHTETLIANPEGAVFLRLTFSGRPFFLSMTDVIDIDAPLPARDFDIRPHFLQAVPVVLYVKWAFAGTGWQSSETTACLVIDDPLLRPKYGHLNYEHLLGLMERLNFSTSIAFIPWNWNRSSAGTVKLFKDKQARFSLSVHGCDHTAGEFGGRDRARLAWKSRESIRRMARHRQKTGLAHDQVMIFPQGVFSGEAMAAVKHGEFIGTVSSEVISADPPARPVTIADYWEVAVMNYSDFPIFTRRYPWAGAENFAFDILLGKPCIVAIHHNDCHDGYKCLSDCIERLNKLNVKLRWTSLAEVIRRSFRWREISPSVVELEMYGSEVRLFNPSGEKKVFRICKRESTADAITGITVESQPVKWVFADNQVTFETDLFPEEAKTVTITYKPIPLDGIAGEGLGYRIKAGMRRYLSEVRDNHFQQKMFSK